MSVPQPPFHSVSEELLYNIYLKFGDMGNIDSLKESDINTLAKINAILTDGDLMKADEITSLINTLKGNAPAEGNTIEKLYALLQPVLSAWLPGGNVAAEGEVEAKPIGTKDNFPLPFITANTERARLDTNGNFLLGWNGVAKGKIHIRAIDALEQNFAAFIEDPTQHILFGVTNSGKVMISRSQSNLLINGGWPSMSGARNLVITSGEEGGKLVDTGNDNIIVGYHAASSAGADPSRGLSRNVVIGTEAGSSDLGGSSYEDSVYIGYKAGAFIGKDTAHRNTMIGAKAGAILIGSDHTLIGYDAQVAKANNFNTLIGSGTRAYNNLGDLISDGAGLSYMTAIGAGAGVRTANTIVIGRVNDQIVLGTERSDHRLPGVSDNTGLEGFKLHVIKTGGLALGVSGYALFRDGNFTIALGEEGSGNVVNTFRINTLLQGYGGAELLMSAANLNAAIEINDYQFAGTRNELMRLNTGGYANTGILIRPNDLYNTAYGYRYQLEGTNTGQQGRYVSAFHAQVNFPVDDTYANSCSTQLFAAKANISNHYLDGFYAEIKGADSNAQTFAYRSLGSRSKFDGTGMNFFLPVVNINTDNSAHAGANALLSNGGNGLSSALFINPMGAERTGMIISPGQAQSNGLFIGSQQSLNTHNYDGYLMWLQYSTNGNDVLGGTDKPMLYIRKHNAPLNNFDHTGAFIRLEENIGSNGDFLEAYRYDGENNVLKLKFAVDKNGVVSIGQLFADPAPIQGVGRIYFVGEEMKFVSPSGEVRTVQHN